MTPALVLQNLSVALVAARLLGPVVLKGLMNMRLSRDDILKAEDVKTVEVKVPEWGGEVLVRGMTGRQRDEFEAGVMERRGRKMIPNTANVRAKIVAQCVVDETGERMFSDSDVKALGEKSGAPIDRIYTVAAKLSGMSDDDVEELIENFSETASGGSSSSSRKTSSAR